MLTLVLSLVEAQRTIACDLIPLIATGFRLQRTQTILSCQRIITRNKVVSQLYKLQTSTRSKVVSEHF